MTPAERIREIVEQDEANERSTIDAYEDTYRFQRERDDFRKAAVPELVWLLARHVAGRDTETP